MNSRRQTPAAFARGGPAHRTSCTPRRSGRPGPPRPGTDRRTERPASAARPASRTRSHRGGPAGSSTWTRHSARVKPGVAGPRGQHRPDARVGPAGGGHEQRTPSRARPARRRNGRSPAGAREGEHAMAGRAGGAAVAGRRAGAAAGRADQPRVGRRVQPEAAQRGAGPSGRVAARARVIGGRGVELEEPAGHAPGVSGSGHRTPGAPARNGRPRRRGARRAIRSPRRCTAGRAPGPRSPASG